jgi:hypothetical protein
MIETDMGIPFSFNFGRLTIEAEPGYVFPAHNSTGFSGSKGFVFLLSGYFRIF